ncbi:hypothetical protein PF005_g20563 [Phytophthora fragariae]|uniref:WW domain-containing protein n=1 Tax=Phytophthora fragariae TaxID=53985 RepID=A0A6A3E4Q4_9STRA|nr:hypothetical protein PF009_g22404 [Phytophthora fragariae]KAE8986138.1 hypothetical protein PF011_g20116 [Phytophthora fragariae]KAE9083203.1 hypothetical protein PF007_g21999 [Phytophthora fragariae]KAE9087327.1 hypothetical protein PF010_g19773 [Phytophthora fragariae]KAE9110648.1 hypothetical protein PF006_g20402 [Phytophthora fragariae]
MRGGASKKPNDSGTPHFGSLTPEKAVDVICRSFRFNQSWVPSKALSRCLSVPYQRFLIVTTPKDDLSNLIWTSVLVLVYCATHLVDYHESWYEVADASMAWLRQQQHFEDQREDLVAPDPAIAQEDAALLREGWQRCYLDEPPYTAYYWNAETNHSTWRHPLETAQMERELKEQKEKRQALLAKVLPLRLPINRDVEPLTEAQVCSECAARGTQRVASVLCLECGVKYFCDACCDAVHCDRIKRSHLADGLRFKECFGRAGFPKIVPKPRTPFMIYQEELQKQQQQQEEEQASTESSSPNTLVIQN